MPKARATAMGKNSKKRCPSCGERLSRENNRWYCENCGREPRDWQIGRRLDDGFSMMARDYDDNG